MSIATPTQSFAWSHLKAWKGASLTSHPTHHDHTDSPIQSNSFHCVPSHFIPILSFPTMCFCGLQRGSLHEGSQSGARIPSDQLPHRPNCPENPRAVPLVPRSETMRRARPPRGVDVRAIYASESPQEREERLETEATAKMVAEQSSARQASQNNLKPRSGDKGGARKPPKSLTPGEVVEANKRIKGWTPFPGPGTEELQRLARKDEENRLRRQ